MVASRVLKFDLHKYATERRILIEKRLEDVLSTREPALLWESMRYSVLSGGKRIRALLCLASAEAIESAGQQSAESQQILAQDKAIACACAIELIHAMSLIHDDLPCMDNDDVRRGKPTNHKVFGEATALLAGDALLVFATEILIRQTPATVSPDLLLDVIGELHRATGPEGMVGGQVADSIATGLIHQSASIKMEPAELNAALLESIHKRKTGALLRFSTWSGARLAGADERLLKILGRYGELLGLAFQIADDLLDVTGDVRTLGKTPGKDEASGKLTWVSLHGIERSQKQLTELEQEGKSLLTQCNLPEAGIAPLNALLEFAIYRSN